MRNVKSQDNADLLEHARTKMCSALYQLVCAPVSCRQHQKWEAKEASWVSSQSGNLTTRWSNIPLHGNHNKAVLTKEPRSQPPGIVYYNIFCIWTHTTGWASQGTGWASQGTVTCSTNQMRQQGRLALTLSSQRQHPWAETPPSC